MADNSHEPTTSNQPRTRVQRAEQRLVHWSSEAEQIERERAGMKWVPRIGLPIGLVLAIFIHGWIGVGVIALTGVTWVMGTYMLIVRRAEFAHHVRDAHTELNEARAEELSQQQAQARAARGH